MYSHKIKQIYIISEKLILKLPKDDRMESNNSKKLFYKKNAVYLSINMKRKRNAIDIIYTGI